MINKVILLSKPNCPNCNNLKMYLKLALRNKYEDDIIVYDKIDDEESFNHYKDKFNVLSLPVLIFKEEILRDISPTKTLDFLEKNIGKK